MAAFHPEDYYLPNGTVSFGAPQGPHVCAIKRLLARAAHGSPPAPDQNSCVFDEDVTAALRAFQRSEGLPEHAAVTAEVVRRLKEKAERR